MQVVNLPLQVDAGINLKVEIHPAILEITLSLHPNLSRSPGQRSPPAQAVYTS
jgi:hypothetical protein